MVGLARRSSRGKWRPGGNREKILCGRVVYEIHAPLAGKSAAGAAGHQRAEVRPIRLRLTEPWMLIQGLPNEVQVQIDHGRRRLDAALPMLGVKVAANPVAGRSRDDRGVLPHCSGKSVAVEPLRQAAPCVLAGGLHSQMIREPASRQDDNGNYGRLFAEDGVTTIGKKKPNHRRAAFVLLVCCRRWRA